MIKYCIFIIFGIILYLLLNTYNSFSIGIPSTFVFKYYYNSDPPYSEYIGLSSDPNDNQDDDLLGETTVGDNVTDDIDTGNHYREYRVNADNEHDAQTFLTYHIDETGILNQYRQQLINDNERILRVGEQVEIYTPGYLQNIANTVGDNPYLGLRLPGGLQNGDFGIIRRITDIDATNRFGDLLPYDQVRLADIQVYRRERSSDRERILAFVRATNTRQYQLTEELQRRISELLDERVYLVRPRIYQVPIARLRPITNTNITFVDQDINDFIDGLTDQNINEYLHDLRQYTQDLPIMETEFPAGGIPGGATNTQLNTHPRPEQQERPRNRRRIGIGTECATYRV